MFHLDLPMKYVMFVVADNENAANSTLIGSILTR